ncbi:MAG: metallophosphoesterase family protein [Clostridia bacterium]|nr:metallophosphoesterase family protein [Clostridia bacterium]
MKKLMCVILSLVMVLSFAVIGGATEKEKVLQFNEDGKFKIMQVNDTQDVGKGVNEKMPSFLEAALDIEKPDLVVFVGDQLADFYPFATEEDMALSIKNIIEPLQERNIPFLMTLGNHDHDNIEEFTEEEQYAVYTSYENCYAVNNGPDGFTYNVPVLTSDGEEIAFNIYMMNTHNKAESGGYAGVNAQQNEWYKATSAALKADNGGEAVPSMLFQHIPPKEIYSLMKECEANEDGAIYSRRDSKWYKLDETKATGYLGEAPCSEDFDNITGQYETWLECRDVMGAFFAHDHVNNFVGTNEDGITMGYNGGTGFRAYGLGDERSVRIFEYDENDVENYETRLLTYKEATGEEIPVVIVDLFTPALLTSLMKVVYFLFGWLIDLF